MKENNERRSEFEYQTVKRKGTRREKKKKFEKSNEQLKIVNQKNLKDNTTREVNNKNKSTKNNDSTPAPKRKVVKAIEHEQEGVSQYSGEVIKYIATTD